MIVVLDTNALIQIFGQASPHAAIRKALRHGRLELALPAPADERGVADELMGEVAFIPLAGWPKRLFNRVPRVNRAEGKSWRQAAGNVPRRVGGPQKWCRRLAGVGGRAEAVGWPLRLSHRRCLRRLVPFAPRRPAASAHPAMPTSRRHHIALSLSPGAAYIPARCH